MRVQKVFIPVLASLIAGTVMAKGTPEELEKLGKTLTCVGAEKAGTASGVPEFTGKWQGTPPGINYPAHAGKHPGGAQAVDVIHVRAIFTDHPALSDLHRRPGHRKACFHFRAHRDHFFSLQKGQDLFISVIPAAVLAVPAQKAGAH